MQQLSFDPRDPVIEFDGWRFSLQIVTFENLYGIAEPTVEARDDGVIATARGLTWAGGQQRAAGRASLRLYRADDGVQAVVEAASATSPPGPLSAGREGEEVRLERIRCTKLIVRGLPGDAELIGHRWRREAVGEGGTVVHYPATTHTPLAFLALPDGEHLYFESLDERVRAKRFAVMRRDGGIDVELIFEEAAPEITGETRTPPWRIGRTREPAAIARRHEEHVARAFGLRPWETRADVPAWAREIDLVLSLHGMHWSGYVFNTYDAMGDAIAYVAGRIEGRRVLAFLPGWEGRYYWQYGDYRPEPLLGGAEGFTRLAARARDLGARLMPMFGANCVNTNAPGYAGWGAPAEMRSPSGLVFQGNRPDWDTSRAHDPGWQAWLNPGVASWRARLVEQVSDLVKAHDLPAVFFDTTHVWINDAQAGVYEGLMALKAELRARFPDLLVTGEGWYDALGAFSPISHTPGHIPAQWPETFARYNRCFLHLSAGDPSRGSTGVHEYGSVPFVADPGAPHIIPTLTVVDGTLEHAREQVDAVIAAARGRRR